MPILFDGKHPNSSGPPGDGAMDLVATHQRLLVGAAMRTKGPILELGVGWYSTPLLHEVAEAQQRLLITADNNEHWLAQFLPLASSYHEFHLVGWWGEFYEYAVNRTLREYNWGLCFVDHSQPIEREYAVRRLMDRADVLVMHDTEEGFAYGYCRTLPMFKYRYTDKCQKAWTTVASNAVDVSKWFVDLPPVEPSVEVT